MRWKLNDTRGNARFFSFHELLVRIHPREEPLFPRSTPIHRLHMKVSHHTPSLPSHLAYRVSKRHASTFKKSLSDQVSSLVLSALSLELLRTMSTVLRPGSFQSIRQSLVFQLLFNSLTVFQNSYQTLIGIQRLLRAITPKTASTRSFESSPYSQQPCETRARFIQTAHSSLLVPSQCRYPPSSCPSRLGVYRRGQSLGTFRVQLCSVAG